MLKETEIRELHEIVSGVHEALMQKDREGRMDADDAELADIALWVCGVTSFILEADDSYSQWFQEMSEAFGSFLASGAGTPGFPEKNPVVQPPAEPALALEASATKNAPSEKPSGARLGHCVIISGVGTPPSVTPHRPNPPTKKE